MTRPPAIRPGGSTRRMMEVAVSDLPLPDSPTRPSVSPGFRTKLTSITAGTKRASTSNPVVRCSTASSGAVSDIDLRVLAEYRAQRVRDLTQRGPRLHRVDDDRHQVLRPARSGADRIERAPPRRLIARRTDLPHALDLSRLDPGIDLQHVDWLRLGGRELVHADD